MLVDSASWMSPAVHALQSRLGDVGVELRCRETLVTEQFLNDAQVRPPFEQVRCVGVAKRVRIDVATRHTPLEDPPDVTGAQTPSPAVQEERLWGRVGGDHVAATIFEPELHRVEPAVV